MTGEVCHPDGLKVRLTFTCCSAHLHIVHRRHSLIIFKSETDILNEMFERKPCRYQTSTTTERLQAIDKILWKYSIQNLKTADTVLLSLFMKDNGRCDIPHNA